VVAGRFDPFETAGGRVEHFDFGAGCVCAHVCDRSVAAAGGGGWPSASCDSMARWVDGCWILSRTGGRKPVSVTFMSVGSGTLDVTPTVTGSSLSATEGRIRHIWGHTVSPTRRSSDPSLTVMSSCTPATTPAASTLPICVSARHGTTTTTRFARTGTRLCGGRRSPGHDRLTARTATNSTRRTPMSPHGGTGHVRHAPVKRHVVPTGERKGRRYERGDVDTRRRAGFADSERVRGPDCHIASVNPISRCGRIVTTGSIMTVRSGRLASMRSLKHMRRATWKPPRKKLCLKRQRLTLMQPWMHY